MKNQINLIIVILFLLFSYSSCSNEVDPNYLPSFEGINVDENTIFIYSFDNKNKKIFAVDTKKSKIIHTYQWRGKSINNFIHDSSFDINPYLDFYDGYIYKFDVKTGNFIKFDAGYYVDLFFIFDNKLWASNWGYGDNNKSFNYFTYESKNNAIEYETISEGNFRGNFLFTDNTYYLELYYNDKLSKIYNYRTKKIIDINLFEEKYRYLHFKKNNYLVGNYYDSNYKDMYDIYCIDSFEPEIKYRRIFSTDSYWKYIGNYEEVDNLLYSIDRSYISIRDKNKNYEVILEKEFDSYSSSWGEYIKNGFIWFVTPDNSGIYKINMKDLTHEVVR